MTRPSGPWRGMTASRGGTPGSGGGWRILRCRRRRRRGGYQPPGKTGSRQGAVSTGDAPPIVVVAKSAKLRFRLRRKLRPLPCSSFPHRAGRGGGPFWLRQKENAPRPVEKKKCSAGRSAPAQTSCRRRGKVGSPSRQSGTETRRPWGNLQPGEVWDTSSFSFRCRWPVIDESFSIGQGNSFYDRPGSA